MNDAKREVAFVGLGRMGVPMARNLGTAGFRVRGFDSSEAAQIYGLLDLAGMSDLDFSAVIRFLAGRGRPEASQ